MIVEKNSRKITKNDITAFKVVMMRDHNRKTWCDTDGWPKIFYPFDEIITSENLTEEQINKLNPSPLKNHIELKYSDFVLVFKNKIDAMEFLECQKLFNKQHTKFKKRFKLCEVTIPKNSEYYDCHDIIATNQIIVHKYKIHK